MVDLQTQVQDAVVKIYFRTDYTKRRNGVQLYTSSTLFSSYPEGQLCHTVTGRADGTDIPDVVIVTCSGTWRYLMVYTQTDNDGQGAVLDFGEVEVLGCDGTYGVNCTKSCSSRQCAVTPTSCDRYMRACPAGGCKSGYMGTDCTQGCNGTYGANCDKPCSSRQCTVTPTSCDRYTGACPPGGCKAGFMGTDCAQECTSGAYSANCGKSCSTRQCRTPSSFCDRETGQCSDGCQDGWRGDDCTTACSHGYYGRECNTSCGRCSNQDSCDHVTGTCGNGCEPGLMTDLCQIPCDREHYGRNCEGVCANRQCAGGSTCSPSTGQCDGGCQAGWTGIDCTKEKLTKPPTKDQTGVIAGSVTVVIVIILILVVIGVIVWKRKSVDSKAKNSPCHNNTASQRVRVQDEESETRIDQSVPVGHYDTLDDAMSRGMENIYTTIDCGDHKDQTEPVGQSNVTEGNDYEPVPGRTFENLTTAYNVSK